APAVKLCICLLIYGVLLMTLQLRNHLKPVMDLGKALAEKNQVKTDANLLTLNSSLSPDAEAAHTKSKFVTIDGTRLHFVLKGIGRPVVLIHGNPGSSQDWARVFGLLAANHKAIAFDRPGHGRSQRPKHEEATVEVQARLLHDALGQLLVQRPILI